MLKDLLKRHKRYLAAITAAALLCFAIGFMIAASAPPPPAPVRNLNVRVDPTSQRPHSDENPSDKPADKPGRDNGVSPDEAANDPEEKMDVYGKSNQGRSLRAYVLGSGSNSTMIFADIHGDDRSAPAVVQKLREYLKRNPEQWGGCQVILIPYANPDGWNAKTRVNGNGVDIDQNFPAGWSAESSQSHYNPGPAAASEPETKSIIQLIAKYNPQKIISIQQPKYCLTWDGEGGQALAKVIQPLNGYTIKAEADPSSAGSLGAYCAHELRVGLLTLELPAVSASRAWKDNREALLAAIRYQSKGSR